MANNKTQSLALKRVSIRLPGFDYSQPGGYFITLVTHNRTPLLGTISDGLFIKNDIGEMIEQSWLDLTARFPFIKLDNYSLMPNHFHGILMIYRQVCSDELTLTSNEMNLSCTGTARTGPPLQLEILLMHLNQSQPINIFQI